MSSHSIFKLRFCRGVLIIGLILLFTSLVFSLVIPRSQLIGALGFMCLWGAGVSIHGLGTHKWDPVYPTMLKVFVPLVIVGFVGLFILDGGRGKSPLDDGIGTLLPRAVYRLTDGTEVSRLRYVAPHLIFTLLWHGMAILFSIEQLGDIKRLLKAAKVN